MKTAKKKGTREEEKEKERLKHMRWTNYKALGFFVILALTVYDVSTDILVYYDGQTFADQVKSTNIRIANELYGNYTSQPFLIEFTEQITPGCLALLKNPTEHALKQDLFDCLFALGCSYNWPFEFDPYLNNSLTIVTNETFWEFVDTKTGGTCEFYRLYQQRPFGDSMEIYEQSLKALLAFIILSLTLSLAATIFNFVTFNDSERSEFFTFLIYIFEDLPQMTIQVLMFSYRINIGCWLCVLDQNCESQCSARPDPFPFLNLTDVSDIYNVSRYFQNTILLLYLSMAIVLLNSFVIAFKSVWISRRTRWFFLFFFILPLTLLALWSPIAWVTWISLLPAIGMSGTKVATFVFVLAIVGSVAFPFVLYALFRNYYENSLIIHKKRLSKHEKKETHDKNDVEMK